MVWPAGEHQPSRVIPQEYSPFLPYNRTGQGHRRACCAMLISSFLAEVPVQNSSAMIPTIPLCYGS